MTESANQTGISVPCPLGRNEPEAPASDAVDALFGADAPFGAGLQTAPTQGDKSPLQQLALHKPSRPPHPSPARPAPSISLAWLICLCLVCDFLMVPVFSSLNGPPFALGVALALGIVGCVLAQGCLLAAWLAWSDGPFLRRLATHWKIAAGLYVVWLVGFELAIAGGRVPLIIAATVALGVPLVSIAAQFPLWVARQWFGWRLVREESEEDQPREPPLAIRDLMVATLVVAVSLALARVAPSPDKGEVWPIWAFSFAIASVTSSIALLPAGALLLRSRDFNHGLAWSGLYAGSWIALPWVIAGVVHYFGTAMLPPWQLFVGLSSLMFTFAATLILTAAIARDRGYRLASGRQVGPSGP